MSNSPKGDLDSISEVDKPDTVRNRQYLVTSEMYLMGRIRESELSPSNKSNMDELLIRINMLMDDIQHKPVVTSGYRTEAINKQIGGSTRSAHLTCEAIDLADTNGKLAYLLLGNQHYLVENQLWMESPDKTPGWVHLDTRVRKNRVFIP